MTGVPRSTGPSWLWLGLALPLAVIACATDVGGGAPGTGGGQAGSGAGTAGTSGGAGTSGSAGATGGAGTTGTAGSVTTGSSGTSGAAGTTGSAGTNGRGGTTGSAGTTGAAGRGGGGNVAAGSGGTIGAGGRGGGAGTGVTTGSAGTTGAAGTTGVDPLVGRKALLVVDNPGSLDDGEMILKQTLENRDMTVTVAPGTGPASLANGQNVVIVSSGVGSGDFVPIFKDVAVPMLVFGNSAYSNLGWITGSSGKGTVGSTTLVSLVDATTPLVSDLMTGVGFKMILDSRSTSLYWGTPAPAAIRAVSIMGQPAQLVSFGYEKGAALMTGTAAGRRVGLGVKIDSLQDLTIEGFKLVMAAIEWLAAAP